MITDKAYLVSFATTVVDLGYPDTELRQLRLHQSARQFGINQTISWNRQKLLHTAFYKSNTATLDEKKGAGYWLWKPYIIWDTLQKVPEGSFVIYADNSMYFIQDPAILLELCQKTRGFFLIGMDSKGLICSFAKRKALALMNADYEQIYNAPGTIAGFQIYQKNRDTMRFVSEYLQLCQQSDILTDTFTTEEQLPGFQEHRHDMAVLSVLRIKYDIEGYRTPYQYGNHNKMPEFREAGEFLFEGTYDEETFNNSPYHTLLHWDKNGQGCKRPLHHYLNPQKLMAKLKTFVS